MPRITDPSTITPETASSVAHQVLGFDWYSGLIGILGLGSVVAGAIYGYQWWLRDQKKTRAIIYYPDGTYELRKVSKDLEKFTFENRTYILPTDPTLYRLNRRGGYPILTYFHNNPNPQKLTFKDRTFAQNAVDIEAFKKSKVFRAHATAHGSNFDAAFLTKIIIIAGVALVAIYLAYMTGLLDFIGALGKDVTKGVNK